MRRKIKKNLWDQGSFDQASFEVSNHFPAVFRFVKFCQLISSLLISIGYLPDGNCHKSVTVTPRIRTDGRTYVRTRALWKEGRWNAPSALVRCVMRRRTGSTVRKIDENKKELILSLDDDQGAVPLETGFLEEAKTFEVREVLSEEINRKHRRKRSQTSKRNTLEKR